MLTCMQYSLTVLVLIGRPLLINAASIKGLSRASNNAQVHMMVLSNVIMTA